MTTTLAVIGATALVGGFLAFVFRRSLSEAIGEKRELIEATKLARMDLAKESASLARTKVMERHREALEELTDEEWKKARKLDDPRELARYLVRVGRKVRRGSSAPKG